MTQQHYIELLQKKAAAYDRLFKHYNNHDCVALADFILNDEFYAKNKKEGDDEE
jgi:hypothetical protein